MTISVTDIKISSVGPGTAAPFATIAVGWLAAEFIVYEVVNATGIGTLLTEGVEYTIALGTPLPAVATITPAASRPATVTWVVYRITPDTQSLDYVAQGNFPAESHEEGLDRAAARSQEHRWQQLRTMRLSEIDVDRDMELPIEADRASKLASYDANGQPTATDLATLTPTPVSLGVPAQTLLPYATIALWQTYLEIAASDGSVDNLGSGTDAGKGTPVAFGQGAYFATDTMKAYYSDGASWFDLGIDHLARASISATIAGRVILDTDRHELAYDTGAAIVPVRTLPPNHLDGLTMTWVDATNFQLEAGNCRAFADAGQGSLAAVMSKTRNTAGAWTAGAAGNMAEYSVGTFALATDTWYYVFALMKPDGTLDWGIDDSATAANLLFAGSGATVAGFTMYRRVGMVRTNLTGLGEFDEWLQTGDRFEYLTEKTLRTESFVNILDDASGGSDLTLDWAPPGFVVELEITKVTGTDDYMDIEPTDVGHGTVAIGRHTWNPAAPNQTLVHSIRTDSSRRIHMRAATAADADFDIVVNHWIDHRGKDL